MTSWISHSSREGCDCDCDWLNVKFMTSSLHDVELHWTLVTEWEFLWTEIHCEKWNGRGYGRSKCSAFEFPFLSKGMCCDTNQWTTEFKKAQFLSNGPLSLRRHSFTLLAIDGQTLAWLAVAKPRWDHIGPWTPTTKTYVKARAVQWRRPVIIAGLIKEEKRAWRGEKNTNIEQVGHGSILLRERERESSIKATCSFGKLALPLLIRVGPARRYYYLFCVMPGHGMWLRFRPDSTLA